MIWNEQTISDLKTLWAEGLSTSEIGRRLECSKNAIVGKAHRLELEPRESPIHRAAPQPTITKNTLPPLPSSFRPEITVAPTGRPRSITEEQERRVLYFFEASEAQCAALVGVSRYAVAAVRERQRRAQGLDPAADVPVLPPEPRIILVPTPERPPIQAIAPIPAFRPKGAACLYPTGGWHERVRFECSEPRGTVDFPDSSYCPEHHGWCHERRAGRELMAAE